MKNITKGKTIKLIQYKFVLKQDEYFFLKCGNIPIEEVAMPYFLDVIWSGNNKKTVIGQAYSFDIINNLIELLSDALDNKLFFDEQVYLNIGLIWDMFSTPDEAKAVVLQYAAQQGLKGELLDQEYVPNLLCSSYAITKKHKRTFIYNNELGDIVLLVSRQFFWKEDPRDSDRFDTSESALMEYVQFLKNYKPFLKKIIPHEIAQQWLLQAKYLDTLFRKNEFGNCVNCKKDSNVEIDLENHPNGLYHDRETKK